MHTSLSRLGYPAGSYRHRAAQRRIIDARQPIKHALDGAPLGVGAGLALILKIYEEGIPSANVPPCASCHGPDGKGADAFPRLAGQLPDYIFRKLTNWDKERGQNQNKSEPDTSAIMQPIAHELTEEQIKGVAAYVSQLN